MFFLHISLHVYIPGFTVWLRQGTLSGLFPSVLAVHSMPAIQAGVYSAPASARCDRASPRGCISLRIYQFTRTVACMDLKVRKDEAKDQYVLYVDGEEAGFAAFIEEDGKRVFNHTVIHDEFQGQGLSKPLIQEALEATKDEGLPYTATCSAVVRFIEKNPEYQS